MLKIPDSRSEFLLLAARSYITGTTLREFKEDLRTLKKLQSLTKSWQTDADKVNVRAWLNLFVICFNQFGTQTSALIMYDMEDSQKELMAQALSFLGRRDPLVDQYQDCVDERLIEEFQKI